MREAQKEQAVSAATAADLQVKQFCACHAACAAAADCVCGPQLNAALGVESCMWLSTAGCNANAEGRTVMAHHFCDQ